MSDTKHFLLAVAAIFSVIGLCFASGGVGVEMPPQTLRRIAVCQIPARSGGTFDVAQATGIDGSPVLIAAITPYMATAGSGIVSTSLTTNDTTPLSYLGSIALLGLTGGRNLTPYTTASMLGDGKKLLQVNVGVGTAGSFFCCYRIF